MIIIMLVERIAPLELYKNENVYSFTFSSQVQAMLEDVLKAVASLTPYVSVLHCVCWVF